jgi:iron(III) transport system substrate-binding protein
MILIRMMVIIAVLGLAASCGGGPPKKDTGSKGVNKAPKDQLLLYTSRYYQEDQVLFDEFEERYNTTVNVELLEGSALLERLRAERDNRKADLIFFNDLSLLKAAETDSLLQPFSAPVLEENVASPYKGPRGNWVGMTRDFVGVAYAKGKVNPKDLEDPTNLRRATWKDQIVLPTANDPAWQNTVATMLTQQSKGKVAQWLKGITDNAIPERAATDFETIEMIANEQASVGLIRASSLVQYTMSGDPDKFKRGEQVGFVFFEQPDNKCYPLLSVAGITSGTPNWQDASLLLSFLSETPIQEQYNGAVRSYSVNPMALPSDFLIDLGGFREGRLDYDLIWSKWEQAGQLMDDNNWK